MTFINGESLSSVRAKINDTLTAVAGMFGFSKVVVAGQADVIAPLKNSTLTLVAGTNVTLTTDGGANSVTISSSGGGGGGSSAWGGITGILSAQTDLQAALDAKATTAQGALADTASQPGHTHAQADVTDLVTDLSNKQPLATVLTNTTASFTTAQETKLSGIATGATANAADAALRDRATHTGTQAAATITGLATVATSGSASDLGAGTLPAARFDDTAHGARTGGTLHANAVAAGAAGFMTGADKTKLDGVATGANLYVHPNHSGDVTSVADGATTIVAGAVTLAKQANVATGTVFYRKTAATGVPEVQTLATLKTDLGLTGTNSGDQATIVGITGTKAQFDTAVTDGNVQWVGDAPTAHTHLLAAGATDVTVTAANLNTLDDGVNTTLHFHDADRARAVHTGTQLAATISDFSAAVAATASVTANTAKVTNATHTGDVTGATALTIDPTAISGKTLVTAVGADHLMILDATDGLLKKALASDLLGAGGATNLSYTAATRVIASDTGTDATLPLVTTGDAGLAPASGGGTTNFLRADGTWAVPAGGSAGSPIISWLI